MFGSFAGLAMKNNEWYLDSGASAQMCSDDNMFSNGTVPRDADVVVANKSTPRKKTYVKSPKSAWVETICMGIRNLW